MRAEVTKDGIDEMLRSVLAEDEYFDKLGQLPEVEGEFYSDALSARSALMRNAGVPTGAAFAQDAHEGATELADERLKRFGCDFIKAGYLTAGAMGMKGDAIDFVLMLLAASGGTNRRLIITDEKLAYISGYSARTVQTKRKAYIAWSETPEGWTAIKITEGKYDHESGKNVPTEYEVPFALTVIRGLREWRTYYQTCLLQQEAPDKDAEAEQARPTLWADMREEREATAFAESTKPEVFKHIVEKVVPETLTCDPNVKRKNKNTAQPAEPKQPKDIIAINDAKMLALLKANRDESRRNGVSAFTWWQGFKQKAAITLAEKTPGHPDPEEE